MGRSMHSTLRILESLANSHLVPCRIGKEPAETTREQVIYARKLYESAFHPDTGDLQNVFGRMSFQVPGGMAITGAMLQFYKYFAELDSLGYSIPSVSRSLEILAFGDIDILKKPEIFW